MKKKRKNIYRDKYFREKILTPHYSRVWICYSDALTNQPVTVLASHCCLGGLWSTTSSHNTPINSATLETFCPLVTLLQGQYASRGKKKCNQPTLRYEGCNRTDTLIARVIIIISKTKSRHRHRHCHHQWIMTISTTITMDHDSPP